MARVSNEALLKEASKRIGVAMSYFGIERSQVIEITNQTLTNYGSGLQGRSMRQTKAISEALTKLGVPKYFLLEVVDNEPFITLSDIFLGYELQKQTIAQLNKDRASLAEEYKKVLEKFLSING